MGPALYAAILSSPCDRRVAGFCMVGKSVVEQGVFAAVQQGTCTVSCAKEQQVRC